MDGLLILIIGIVVVVLWGRVRDTRSDLQALSARLENLEQRSARTRQDLVEPVAQPVASYRPDPPKAPEPKPVQPPIAATAPVPLLSEEPHLFQWLLGTNPVVRVGIVVLLCGVAFFLNYVIERGWLPVEVRLTMAAIGGLALTAIGWRLRESQRDYGLVLQGGGIGIVYMTVFAAVNLYAVLGAGSGLALMVALVVLTSAFAVLQNSQSMAVFASLAGFAAPVFVSHGDNHVALFSYYAVLDASILAIAWFRRWQLLNRLGFVCTFLLSAAWGTRYYTPRHFATTEPFLVVFFMFYVIVPVLFARGIPDDRPSPVDGPLVFGVPIVAFGLQAQLVRDFEYGLAFSALGAAIFYGALASALLRRAAEFPRTLVEALFALGVGFGTLAIPLAFTGRWTAAAWAIEGAGLVWLGVRQQQPRTSSAGVFLQAAAGLALLSASPQGSEVPLANTFCLGALMISGSAFFSGLYLQRHRTAITAANEPSVALLAWSLLWWCAAGSREISMHVAATHEPHAFLMFATATAAMLTILRDILSWRQLSVPVLLLLPVMSFTALQTFLSHAHPLHRLGSVAWVSAIAAHCWIHRRLSSDWPEWVNVRLHQGMLLLVVFLASWELAWLAGHISRATDTWRHVAWVVVSCGVIAAAGVIRRGDFLRLSSQFVEAYRAATVLLAAAAGLWLLFTSITHGDPAPLTYVPFVNPLEAVQCLVLGIMSQWLCATETRVNSKMRGAVVSMLGFVVLNGIIARATHFLTDVEFHWLDLWTSSFYQAAVSIVWTISAVVLMVIARRRQQRQAWYAGALLLSVVVSKLFAVDLDDVGTVARIVSFLCVGLLMVLTGYLSPLPPRFKEN